MGCSPSRSWRSWQAASPARAQITTGNISGTVQDAQGGVIPGATVVLKSESRGTALAPVVTNEAGVYVFPNVTPDVYTIEVTMDSFKTVRRTGIRVSGGDRVGVPAMVLEAGGVAETVNVTAEALLVQSQSAERSFAVSSEQIEGLPINRQNFTNLLAFAPGVKINSAGSTGFERLGGVSQNNMMMDGISAMDTGNNGPMLAMNIESIGEVKILTQGYQAEFGRSSGLQITAVTKSGTNRFRGSVYDVERDSDWNSNSWVNQKNGDAEADQRRKATGATRWAVRSASRAATTSCSSSTATSIARGTRRSTTATRSGSACRPRPSATAISRRASTTTAR